MRIALVHEWLVSYAGSERVFEQMLHIWPQADLFCVIDALSGAERGFLGGRTPRTTFIQRLPFLRKNYRRYLPLMPFAIERIDLSAYDVIVSSSHAVAKGVRKHPGQVHVSYIHSPMRYAWDLREQYLSETGLNRGLKGRVVRSLLDRLQHWDQRNSAAVDVMVANSRYVAERVQRCYGREAEVIYPPVNVERFTPHTRKESFYLTAGRLVPYKRVPLIVEAFARMPERRLVVIGDGPEAPRLREALARAPNVEWLGYQGDATLIEHMQRARAFVFAAEEDFGIIPLEAQACGTPVIAFGRGGSLETVRGDAACSDRTGVFFDEQTPAAIRAAIERFEAQETSLTAAACRAHAETFGEARFRSQLAACVSRAVAVHT